MRMNDPNPFTLAYITRSSARHDKLCRGDRLIPTISRLASDVFLSLELHPTPKPRSGPNLDDRSIQAEDTIPAISASCLSCYHQQISSQIPQPQKPDKQLVGGAAHKQREAETEVLRLVVARHNVDPIKSVPVQQIHHS